MSSRQFNKPPRNLLQSLPSYIIVPSIGLAGSCIYAYFSFLDEVPVSKRKRLLATSPSWEKQMGDHEYKNLLKQYRKDILTPTHPASRTIRRVGSRVAAAAEDFAKENLLDTTIHSKDYTYTVVRSETANAFVLPNNHVFILSGIFQYAKDEDELAAVIGHEMAHNLARHVGEKISTNILIAVLARVILLVDPSGLLCSVFIPAAKLLHELPHSRDAEVEADQIGIHLAARACYDPKAAIRVFSAMRERQTSIKKVSGPPEFASTHPSYDTRIDNFKKWMPEAQAIFNSDKGRNCRHVRDEMMKARREALKAAKKSSDA